MKSRETPKSHSLVIMMGRFFLPFAMLIVLGLSGAGFILSQESRPPIGLEELLGWVSLPEAQHPYEEIVDSIKKFNVSFSLSPASEAQIRTRAESAARPADFTRQILQAVKDNWVFDRIRLLARHPEGLGEIASLVLERDVQIPYEPAAEKAIRAAGGDEPVLALLWPPVAPEKPKFKFQEWRVPRQNIDPTPLRFDPDAVRGQVEITAVVDGKVLLVLKHNTIFYNVICGNDLDLQRAHFSSPLPRLESDRWEYRLDLSKKKPRGHVFACPQDRQCDDASVDKKKKKPESLCTWYDLQDPADAHGYSNARFVIDDYQAGSGEYQVVFEWAIKPYTAPWLADDLRKYGVNRVLQKMFAWGVSFVLDPQTENVLRDAGANQKVFEGLSRVYRQTNVINLKVH